MKKIISLFIIYTVLAMNFAFAATEIVVPLVDENFDDNLIPTGFNISYADATADDTITVENGKMVINDKTNNGQIWNGPRVEKSFPAQRGTAEITFDMTLADVNAGVIIFLKDSASGCMATKIYPIGGWVRYYMNGGSNSYGGLIQFAKNQLLQFKMIVDVKNNTYDVYINGQKYGNSNMGFYNRSFNSADSFGEKGCTQIDTIMFQAGEGAGVTYIDNVAVKSVTTLELPSESKWNDGLPVNLLSFWELNSITAQPSVDFNECTLNVTEELGYIKSNPIVVNFDETPELELKVRLPETSDYKLYGIIFVDGIQYEFTKAIEETINLNLAKLIPIQLLGTKTIQLGLGLSGEGEKTLTITGTKTSYMQPNSDVSPTDVKASWGRIILPEETISYSSLNGTSQATVTSDNKIKVSVLNSYWGGVKSEPFLVDFDKNPQISLNIDSLDKSSRWWLRVYLVEDDNSEIQYDIKTDSQVLGFSTIDLKPLVNYSGIKKVKIGLGTSTGTDETPSMIIKKLLLNYKSSSNFKGDYRPENLGIWTENKVITNVDSQKMMINSNENGSIKTNLTNVDFTKNPFIDFNIESVVSGNWYVNAQIGDKNYKIIEENNKTGLTSIDLVGKIIKAAKKENSLAKPPEFSGLNDMVLSIYVNGEIGISEIITNYYDDLYQAKEAVFVAESDGIYAEMDITNLSNASKTVTVCAVVYDSANTTLSIQTNKRVIMAGKYETFAFNVSSQLNGSYIKLIAFDTDDISTIDYMPIAVTQQYGL